MKRDAAGPRTRALNWKAITLILVGTGIAALTAANAHLVYVALDSQPACVPHAAIADGTLPYRAARSAC